VWFDRIEVEVEPDASGITTTLVARETFKVQVPPN
jgi:hypothetical protein